MLVQTKAIVLSQTKYQDKSLIVKCLTKEVGMQTFFVRNAFSKGKTAHKTAYFQPLMMLDINFIFKNKANMEYFKDIKVGHIYQSIYYDYTKNCIAIFVGELLNNLISEQERDSEFYDFIEASLLWFDTHEHTANFHLILMVELAKWFGFYPDRELEVHCNYFDANAGVFSVIENPDCFTSEQTSLFKRLLLLGFDDNQLTFSAVQRRVLLELLMVYYHRHLSSFRTPNSLEILKEIFSN